MYLNYSYIAFLIEMDRTFGVENLRVASLSSAYVCVGLQYGIKSYRA